MELVVVKVGGSLAMYPQSLLTLCKKLGMLAKKQQLILVPGGGEFADTIRVVDKRFNLTCATSHKMAILAMDQYGLMLSDLLPESELVSEFQEVEKIFDSGGIPLFLPSRHFFIADPLENSWGVTSDSIALYVAAQLKASKLLLVTDVDGVYNRDPRKNSDAKLLAHVSPKALIQLPQRTSVDDALPKLLLQWQIECYVVNGLFPERIDAILDGQNAVFTLISGKQP